MESKDTVEGNQPRISFKIGGCKADAKANDTYDSEAMHTSSGESNHTVSKISAGLSQASTLSVGQLPASQDDIFATQLEESSFAADSSTPLQSSGSTTGPADYDEFIVESKSLDKNGTGPSNSSSLVSSKTSTPRKPKTSGGPTAKRQRITEESSCHSDTKSVTKSDNNSRDRSVAEGRLHLPPRNVTFGGDPSVVNSRCLRRDSDKDCHLASPNKSLSQTSLRSSDGDCEFVKSLNKESTKGIEVITIDASQIPPSNEESPEIKMLRKKARESLEVLYVSSPTQGASTLLARDSLRNMPDIQESQEDSMYFHLSADTPTDSQNRDRLVRSATDGKPITVEDDGDQDCAVTYEDNRGSSHNMLVPLPNNLTVGNSSSLQSTLSMDLEKLKKSYTDSESFILPEINGNVRGNLKTTTYTNTISYTMTVEYDTVSHKIYSSDVVHCEPAAVTEDATRVSSRGLSDLSNGMLADVSDQSKPNSPSSVAGIGPFTLPGVRASIVSTFSSSSTGTSSSGGSVGAVGLKAPSHSSFVLSSMQATMRDRVFPVNNSDQMNALQRSIHHNIKNMDKITEVIERASDVHISKVVEEDSLFVSPKSYVSRKEKTEVVQTTKPHELVPTVASTGHKETNNVEQCIPNAVKSQCTPLQLKDENLSNSTSSPSIGKSPKSANLKTSSSTPKSASKPRYNRNTKSRSKGAKSSTVDNAPAPKEEEQTNGKTTKRSAKKSKATPVRASPASRRRALEVLDTVVVQEDAVNLAVFARWPTDKKYYSGKIVNQTKDGRYNVLFDDGNTKCLVEEFVVIVTELRKGLLVFAEVEDDGSCESGVIVSMKVVDGVIMYVVELDDSKRTVTVPRSKLFMTEDQVKILMDTDERRPMSPGFGVTSTADTMYKVVPDNIVSGKRIRSLKVNRPGYSGQGRISRNNSFGGKSVEGEEDLSSDDDSGVEREQYPRMNPNCRKGSATERSRLLKQQVYYNPAKSKIFEGMHFLFTCSALSGPVQASSGSSDSSGTPLRMPFIKDALTMQLTAGGGVVLDSFDAIDQLAVPVGSVHLISNGPCLTSTYILCLCRNITILNHEWVIFSSIEGKKLGFNNYYLQAGYSIEKQTYVDQHTGTTRRKRPLNNKNVVLISVRINSTFAKFWTKVLEYLGARVTPMASKPDKDIVEGVDMIVAAPSLMPDLRDWAQELGITAVSTEWMQQCVINWKECAVTTTPESPTY